MANLNDILQPYVTPHALLRLRAHFPNCGVAGAMSILSEAAQVEPEKVAILLGRSLERVADTYFVTKTRTGILVLTENKEQKAWEHRWILVTYLRFGAMQHRHAVSLWPPEAPGLS